jgi:hypothetical protein
MKNSAQLELIFGLVEFRFYFFLHILSSLVFVRLYIGNWLCNLPGSALKVPVVGGGWLDSEYSDRLWLSLRLALAKPNNISCVFCYFV